MVFGEPMIFTTEARRTQRKESFPWTGDDVQEKMPPKEDCSKGCINTEFGIAHASTILGKLQRFFTSFFARSSPPDRAKPKVFSVFSVSLG